MTSFMFGAAKDSVLRANTSLRFGNFGIVPVEAIPSQTATNYGAISGIATAVGGGSLVRTLTDVGGDNNNRVLDDTANGRVALQFNPQDWGAVETTNALPIVGFVVVNSTNPNSNSVPLFFIELVDNLGDSAPFTPNGIDFLTIDLVGNPVAVRDYGGRIFNNYLLEWIRGNRSPQSTTLSLIYCESEPDPTWTTVTNITGRATLPGGGALSTRVFDVGNTSSNRVAWVNGVVNGTAGLRFDAAILNAFATDSEEPVTHYILAEGNPPQSWSNIVSWGQFNPALTTNGSDDQRLSLPAGSTVTI